VRTLRAVREDQPEIVEMTLALSRWLIRAGQADEALALLEPLLETQDGPEARSVLLDYYKDSGRTDRALKLFAERIDDVAAHAAKVEMLWSLPEVREPFEALAGFIDRLEDARAAAGEVAPELPAEGEGDDRRPTLGSRIVLASLAERYDRSAAAEHYEQAIEQAPQFIQLYERHFAMLVGLDRLTAALATARAGAEAARRERVREQMLYRIGTVQELLGRAADAAGVYSAAVRAGEGASNLYGDLVRVLVHLGRTDEADAIVRQRLAEHPDDASAWTDAASYHADLKRDMGRALALLEEGLSLHPDNLWLLSVKAATLVQARRWAEAEDVVQRVLVHPASADVAERFKAVRVSVLMAAERYEEAEAEVRDLMESDPDEPRYRYLLSSLASRRGREEEAVALLREIVAEHPRYDSANNDLGYFLAERGEDLDAAERMALWAVQESPSSAAYLDSLGWVYYKQNRLAEARRYLERSTRLDPEMDAVIWDHLGDVLWRLGERGEARAAWARAHALLEAPGHVPGAEDEPMRSRLGAKLSAVAEGREPPVAPLGKAVE
jgi:tetratricopeptide (TPR) repeat protein